MVKYPRRDEYVVRGDWQHQIVEMIAPRGIQRGLYATAATARFERFETEAEKADWDAEGTISWTNTPFSLWKYVAMKILVSQGGFVSLVPNFLIYFEFPAESFMSRAEYEDIGLPRRLCMPCA